MMHGTVNIRNFYISNCHIAMVGIRFMLGTDKPDRGVLVVFLGPSSKTRYSTWTRPRSLLCTHCQVPPINLKFCRHAIWTTWPLSKPRIQTVTTNCSCVLCACGKTHKHTDFVCVSGDISDDATRDRLEHHCDLASWGFHLQNYVLLQGFRPLLVQLRHRLDQPR